MKVDQFDFELPRELIAQRPVQPRDAARLLVVGPGGIEDGHVRDLPELLRSGDLLVFNDTRVIPARLRGRTGANGGKVEVTLHHRDSADTWRAFAKPARRLEPGVVITFASDFTAVTEAKGEGGQVTLRFDRAGQELMAALRIHGAMPLPPYIKREALADERDRDDYQTVFAANDGAVAAPTAGLHFTPRLLEALEARGVRRARVTLHVGAGTFLPVRVEHVADHVMHAEWGEVSADTARAVASTRAAGGRIVAVGSTSTRLLETATASGEILPFAGWTDIFITPGHEFRAVDLMLTNFHLPRSTLFMLVAALAGLEPMRQAYAHAIAHGYRFYSYGDCCLLHRDAKDQAS